MFSNDQDPCADYLCDRRYEATWVLNETESTCNRYGYGSIFVDDEDREEETYDVALELDVLWNNEPIDHTNVFSYFFRRNTYYEQTLRTGDFVPDTAEDYTGPGTMSWQLPGGFCVTFRD